MAAEAAAAALKFPAAHVPDVARKLLLTAATRGHAAAVQTLASCTIVQQHLDARTVEVVLEQLFKGFYFWFLRMCEVPLASQLDSAAVARLLQAALQHGRQLCASRLLEFPAAQRFSVDMVAQLLHSLLECRTATANLHRLAPQVCRLQAAQQLSSSVVEQLLLAAIELDNDSACYSCTKALCGLTAARQLGSDSVARLLDAAVKHACRGGVYWLCQLPGAQQLDSTALEPVVEAAVLKNQSAATKYLLRLPAAAQLSIGGMV
jgi:hypothetical protein